MAIESPTSIIYHFIIPTMNLDLAKTKNIDIIPGIIKDHFIYIVIFYPRATPGLQRDKENKN